MDILQALQNQYTQSAAITSVISLGPKAGGGDVLPPVSGRAGAVAGHHARQPRQPGAGESCL